MFLQPALTAAPRTLALHGLKFSFTQRALITGASKAPPPRPPPSTSTSSADPDPFASLHKQAISTWKHQPADVRGEKAKPKAIPRLSDQELKWKDPNGLWLNRQHAKWLYYKQKVMIEDTGNSDGWLDYIENWTQKVQGFMDANKEDMRNDRPRSYKIQSYQRQRLEWLNRAKQAFGDDWRAVITERIRDFAEKENAKASATRQETSKTKSEGLLKETGKIGKV